MRRGTHHTKKSRAKTAAALRGRPKSALTLARMRAARRRYLAEQAALKTLKKRRSK